MPQLIQPIEVSEPFGMGAMSERRDWGMDNLGINDKVWSQGCKGEGVLIVVGDTGYGPHRDGKEPLFAENFTSSRDSRDRNGHGQHVAGTIFAQDNGTGYEGAAPEAGYAVLKLLGDNGSNSTTRIAQGYRWLANWWKNRSQAWRAKYHSCIISLSIGGPPDGGAAVKDMWDAGIVVVAAMGNSGGSYSQERGDAPGIYGIGITAINQNNERASFSSVSKYADMACPGVGIVSFGFNDSWVRMSGTSMATPYASGCIGLVLASYRDADLRTHDGLIEFMNSKSPVDLGRAGHDKFYGWGKPPVEDMTQDQEFNFGIAAG